MEKGKGKKKRKGKKKGGKNGDNFFFFFFFFISPCAWFFICAVVIFQIYKGNLFRLSRSYPLLFAIKILMVSQFGDLQEPNMHPTPILATFSNTSGRPKDIRIVND